MTDTSSSTSADAVTRRRIVASAVAAATAASLAGCTGDGGGGGGDGMAGDGGNDTLGDGGDGLGDGGDNDTLGGGNDTADGENQTADGGNQTTDGRNQTTGGGNQTTDGGNQTVDGGAGGQVSQEIDDFLSDANEYTGTIEDATGQSEVTIDVGAGSNGFAFAPAAVRVSTGTLVHWQWTGRGALHNVVSVSGSDASFDSGDPAQGSEPSYEQTFDQPGTMLYVCEPHEAVGMLGAIEVVQ